MSEAEKMHSKPYRFIWFARTSWSYMQGSRGTFITRFWPAWRKFNKLVEDDLKR